MGKRIILSMQTSYLAAASGCAERNGGTPYADATASPSAVQAGAITLSSDHRPLVAGFDWANQQALAYVFEGDPEANGTDNLSEGEIVEVNAYLPEVYYQNRRNDTAFGYLMRQLDPKLPRREYPENPYTAIGTIVHHLVGIDPLASEGVLETESRLTDEIAWVRIDQVPVRHNQVSVHHIGRSETHLLNRSGPAIRWRAVLPGHHATLLVDGVASETERRYTDWGEAESYIVLDVGPGEEASSKRPRTRETLEPQETR